MAEYIEREAIKYEQWPVGPLCEPIMVVRKKIIDSITAADVAPVVHSRWEITDIEHAYGTKCYHCQECGEDEWRDNKPNYCPNCGAKMDGGAIDGTEPV